MKDNEQRSAHKQYPLSMLMSMSMSINVPQYRTVILIRSVYWILLKRMRLRQANGDKRWRCWGLDHARRCTASSGLSDQLRQMHDGRTCWTVSVTRRVGGGWPNLRRCCRSATWTTGVNNSDKWFALGVVSHEVSKYRIWFNTRDLRLRFIWLFCDLDYKGGGGYVVELHIKPRHHVVRK